MIGQWQGTDFSPLHSLCFHCGLIINRSVLQRTFENWGLKTDSHKTLCAHMYFDKFFSVFGVTVWKLLQIVLTGSSQIWLCEKDDCSVCCIFFLFSMQDCSVRAVSFTASSPAESLVWPIIPVPFPWITNLSSNRHKVQANQRVSLELA